MGLPFYKNGTLLVVRPNNTLEINEKARERKRNGDFFRDSGALLKCGVGAKKEKGVAHGATPLESGWTS